MTSSAAAWCRRTRARDPALPRRPSPLLGASLLSTLLLAAVTARAQSAVPKIVEPTPSGEHWSSRPALTWELAAGAELGYRAYKVSPDETRGTGFAGAMLSFGFRSLLPYSSDNLLAGLAGARSSRSFDGWVWCAPVACLGIGMLFMPISSMIGNERGADLRFHIERDFQAGEGGLFLSVGLRPVLRVAVEGSRFRSASLLGAFMPEIGLEVSTRGSKAVYFELSPFPISLYLGHWAAIEWDLARLRFMAPLGDSTASGRFTTGLSFVLP